MIVQTSAPPRYVLPASRCPHSTGEVDGVDLSATRDLAPCHGWLARPPTPVPDIPVEKWENAKHYKVVVVGAGMSGLHTAWKLKDSEPSIGVFERTRHVGGRARSKKVEGAEVPFDLGAMRFIPTRHHLVNGLVEHFQLPTREFVVGGDNNLQYFRGQRFTNAEVAADPARLPFGLRCEEKGKSVDELLAMAIEAVVPNFRDMRPEHWEDAKRNTLVDGVPLYQLGLQNVLEKTLSREALTLVTESVGYQSFLQNWDAGQALEEIASDFKPGTVYRTPLEGMEALPRALAGDLRQAGVDMKFQHGLRKVEREEGKFRLTFENGRGEGVPITADKLVLAMPRKPLEGVVAASPMLQGTPLQTNLDKVTPNPMTRIFATFDQPWWQEQGIQSGRSLTDLELGQVYYYGKPGDTQPFVMVYADGSDSVYWEGLQNPADPGVTTGLCATPQLKAELHSQLEELHGRSLPAPTGMVYKRWADPFMGGAYHTWNPGSKPFDTSEQMLQPVPGLPLYVCGEAYSTSQGWIEGALRTSQKVVEKLQSGSFEGARVS